MQDPTAERVRPILVIDNDVAAATILEQFMSQRRFKVYVAATGEDGLTQATHRMPSLILLSTQLPDGSGMEFYKRLRARSRTAHIPIMFMAHGHDIRMQNELLRAGADDFLTKPLDMDIVMLRVRNAIQRQERDGLHHPRSGLPTGRMLEDHLQALNSQTNWYRIDFGIDNFQSFRDHYGFMSSEEVMSFTVGLISDVVQTAGTHDDFIGQRSDTEYIVITKRTQGAALRQALEKRFNEEVLSFYGFMEREQGYIELPDDRGGTTKKPLMAARITITENPS